MFGRADLADQVDVALVRRHGVHRHRPQRRQAGRLEDNRGLALRQVAAVGQDVRGHHPGGAGLLPQFQHQFLGGAVAGGAGVVLIGRDDIAHEGLHFLRDGQCRLGADAAHACSLSCAPGECGATR